METRAHYVLIGAFMLGGIVLAVIFTLWLGSVEREFDEYDVVFTERVSGLQVGAAVQYNGITVGDVQDLRLAPDNPSEVIARIRVADGTPIKTDTIAELELAGVTGLAIIQLVGGSPAAPLLVVVSDRRVPVLEGEPGGVAAAINSSGELFANAATILSEDNAQTLSRILDDVEALTDVLADGEGDIRRIIEDAAITTSIVRRQAEELDGLATSLNTLLADVDALVAEDAAGAIREVQAAAANTNALVLDLQDTLDDNRPAIDAFAQQGLGSAVGVIAQASRLVDSAESVLSEIDRDPARFLLGEGRPVTE
jgi:phospholipid/cholesterol/gamma-HCH transport system substrate-binding protein